MAGLFSDEKGQKPSWVADFVAKVSGKPLPPSPDLGFARSAGVYFIQTSETSSGPVKIGHTDNLRYRMSHIQTSSAWPIRLLRFEEINDESDRLAREAELHQAFRRFRMKGEWFNVGIMARIETECPTRLR